MELKNKLVVGLLSAMLAFTGLACGGEDAADTDVDVETPAADLSTEGDTGVETEMESPTATEEMSTEDMSTEDMETEAEPTETETP